METNNKIDINKFTKVNSPHGAIDQSLTNALYGLNPLDSESIVYTDANYKYNIFFTRPQLNLTSMNCVLSNELIKLLSENKNSAHRYARLSLDPRLTHSKAAYKSDIFDPLNPFIPVLSNTLVKMSGWPDPVMATRVSKEGYLKEQTIIADGTIDIYNSFDLDLTFRNIISEPITTIFSTWLEYMDKVHKGHLMPYLDMIIRREIDYMTRIYVIVTDETSNIIKKIANIGAGFPISNPMGIFFDYDRYGNNRVMNKDMNIRLKCVGAEYNKYNSMLDFNMLVAAFHPKMKKMHNGDSEGGMMQVPEELFGLFNHRMYPYIDLLENKLLWYIDEEYVNITDADKSNEGRDL